MALPDSNSHFGSAAIISSCSGLTRASPQPQADHCTHAFSIACAATDARVKPEHDVGVTVSRHTENCWLPDPQLGLVISYSYLWHSEHNAGRDEGSKSRPCVIVLATVRQDDGTLMVRVAPVTHSPPSIPSAALEIPPAVKRHLGLDHARSWVILDEVNEFAWPGFDLRPIPPSRDRFTYGFLPPRLFDQMITKLAQVWTAGQGNTTPRD